ncbi:hypothetical protein PIIN_09606, partial [Serendipita indica DSM 11827]
HCENREINGSIIALDQEKAYDRIDHNYLWTILNKYGLPNAFIQRVKNLYTKSHTSIRLNGCTSLPYRVERGVRQGDPLSCLLYNIAIEPLFENIRRSGLKGIKISDKIMEVLVKAYADDTTIFLAESDRFDELQTILDLFCKASTAKFNMEKTEIIPVGNPEHRDQMSQSRIVNGRLMEDTIKIAKDGESVRILGSYQGNNANTEAPWNEITRTQNKIMNLWAQAHPSASGRVMLAKSLIVSRAFYLMTVNGITKPQLNEMEKSIRKFIWKRKKGPIAWELATQQKKNGGIGAPCVKTLYEATKVMWLKRWLQAEPNRPTWAYALNSMLEDSSGCEVDRNTITEWLEQGWHQKPRSTNLTKSAADLIATAKKYNVHISVIRASHELKLNMPAFHHPGHLINLSNNTKTARCLRTNHQVRTIRDITNVIDNRTLTSNCANQRRCRQLAGKILNNLNEKWSTLQNSPRTTSLYHTPRRLYEMRTKDIQEEPVTFNPDPGDGENPLDNIRIFGERKGYLTRNPHETPKHPVRTKYYGPRHRETTETILYTDGSTVRNGFENGESGLGIWHKNRSRLNTAMKITGKAHSNQRAELAAITQALRIVPKTPLLIISDSLTSLNMICHHIVAAEDKGWNEVANADLLQEILARLRTRPTTCRFMWTKGHADDIGNNEADRLADEGRASTHEFEDQELEIEHKLALQDGARLKRPQIERCLLHTN